jgi:hypothetical protein
MKMTKILRVASVMLMMSLPVGLVSCGGTHTTLETTWQLPNADVGPFTRLAVIGIMRNQKESMAFESAMVERLDEDGIRAVPGFSFLEGDTLLPKSEMEERVAGSGANGVLIFKVLALDESENYVPPTSYVVPDGYGLGWWDDPYWGYYNPYPFDYWGYWYPAMQVVGSPGYWTTSTTYQVQTTLYSVRRYKLVWTATSQTYNPGSQASLARSLAGPVIKALEDDDLVRGK